MEIIGINDIRELNLRLSIRQLNPGEIENAQVCITIVRLDPAAEPAAEPIIPAAPGSTDSAQAERTGDHPLEANTVAKKGNPAVPKPKPAPKPPKAGGMGGVGSGRAGCK